MCKELTAVAHSIGQGTAILILIIKVKVKVKLLSRVRLFATPWIVAYQAPPSMGFSRQEHWIGLPFPSPGDLPNPGIEPGSPTFQADALTSELPGKLTLKLRASGAPPQPCSLQVPGGAILSSTCVSSHTEQKPPKSSQPSGSDR